MADKKYEVPIWVNGKSVGSTRVTASNSVEARRQAEYEASGRAGFAGKKIRAGIGREIR